VLKKSFLVFRQRLVAVQQVLDVAVHPDKLAFTSNDVCGVILVEGRTVTFRYLPLINYVTTTA